MTEVLFDVTNFRLKFTEFADPIKYPDILLTNEWDFATCYISPVVSCGNALGDKCLSQALDLMTAHLTKLNDGAKANRAAAQEQSATIDKVSVTRTPAPSQNQWQWLLGTTIYGQQLLALLQSAAAGGLYIGSLPERSSIRNVAGLFPIYYDGKTTTNAAEE